MLGTTLPEVSDKSGPRALFSMSAWIQLIVSESKLKETLVSVKSKTPCFGVNKNV